MCYLARNRKWPLKGHDRGWKDEDDSRCSGKWQEAAEPLLPYLGAVVYRLRADVS
jgi:hypothetical protein